MRKITFWLSLVLIFVMPWENIVEIDGLGTLSRAIGLMVAVLWLATVAITGRFRGLHPFHAAVFLFVLWKVASVFWSVSVDVTVGSLQTYLQLFFLVLILWDLYTTQEALTAGLQTYVLGAYVSVASIVKNQVTGNTALYERFSATGFQVDDIGVILALGIPVAWYLATSERYKKSLYALKLLNYAYVPIALLGIALTGTRTALVAAMPALLYGMGTLNRIRIAGRVAIFVALVAALFVVQSYVPQSSFDRLSTTGESISDNDLNGRVNIWRYGVATFMEHPLIGIGSGAFRSAEERKVAHNTYLSILVEEGIVGFIIFGAILAVAFAQVVRQPKWEARFWLTVLVVWALGAFTLTWEPRKQTWLFLSMAVISANLSGRREDADEPAAQLVMAAGREPRTMLTTGAARADTGSRPSSTYWLAGAAPHAGEQPSPPRVVEQPGPRADAPRAYPRSFLIVKRQ